MRRSAPHAPVMQDVARLAGVSSQTVSRVLNGQPNVRVDTRDRVLDAMRQLSYRPNALARGLANRRSHTIAVIGFDAPLYGPASTMLAIERAARRAGYQVIVSSVAWPDGAAMHGAIDAIVSRSVDGAIVIAPTDSAALEVRDLPLSLPIVALEAGYASDIPVISVDQFLGAQLATDHLLGLGHQTVWHVAGPTDWPEAQERIEGWRDSLARAGAIAPPLIRGDWSPDAGYRAGLRLADDPDVTAVFVANDQMAIGLLCALNERHIRVPQEVSVVGFDDIPESGYLVPSLTTVRQDFDELGRRGLKRLVELMDAASGRQSASQRAPGPDNERIAPTLALRRSTARRLA